MVTPVQPINMRGMARPTGATTLPRPVNVGGQVINQPRPVQMLSGQPVPEAVAATSAPAPQLPKYGLTGSEQALSQMLSGGLQQLQGGTAGALSALTGANKQGLEMLTAGDQALIDALESANRQLSGARSGVSSAVNTGRSDIQSGRTSALDYLSGAFDTARQDLSGFDYGGREAIETQAALSGAMGPEAQRAAMNAVMNSPEFDFIQEQGRREILANAAATGGTGGGEILRDLTRFGQGLASQRFDTAYNRLGQVGDRGLNVAQMLSGLSAQLGSQQAGVETSAANALSNLQAQLASAKAQLGSAGANIASNIGANRAGNFATGANLTAQLAGQGANALMQGGTAGANLYQNVGSQLSDARLQAGRDIAAQLGGQSSKIADLINQQGQQIGSQIDAGTTNLVNMLAGAGGAEAADLIRMAELYQALASQNAASGSAAIGQGGTVAANAQLAQGANFNDMLSNLVNAYGIYKGQA